MNTYTQHNPLVEQHRARLEGLVNRPNVATAYDPQRLGRLLSHWGQRLVHWLTSGDTPRISQTLWGDTLVWKAYDPVSRQTRYFEKEQALRIWLEKRYYQ